MSKRTGNQKGSDDEADPAPNGTSSLFATGGSSRSRLAPSSRLGDTEVQKALGGDYTPKHGKTSEAVVKQSNLICESLL